MPRPKIWTEIEVVVVATILRWFSDALPWSAGEADVLVRGSAVPWPVPVLRAEQEVITLQTSQLKFDIKTNSPQPRLRTGLFPARIEAPLSPQPVPSVTCKNSAGEAPGDEVDVNPFGVCTGNVPSPALGECVKAGTNRSFCAPWGNASRIFSLNHC